MKVRHSSRGLCHRSNDIIGEIAWMRGHEAQPLEAFDCADFADQFRKGTPLTEIDPISIYILAQQGDLNDSLLNERSCLVQDGSFRAVLLDTSQ